MTQKKHSACPFCGGEVDPTGWLRGDGLRGPECDGCGATAPTMEVWEQRAALAPPSPAQEAAEDREKPEIVAFIHGRTGAVANADMVRVMEEGSVPSGYTIGLMTVTQHDRLALERWQYFRRKMRQMRDLMRGMRDRLTTAQARVAELELKLDSSDYAYDSDRSHMRGMAKKAADALQVITGHDSGANLCHRYGEKWWEPLNELRDMLQAFVKGAPFAQAGQVQDILTEDDMKWLHRFAECCEDSEAGGHDLPKGAVKQLVQAGALRHCGAGRTETTAFGDWLLAAAPAQGGE